MRFMWFVMLGACTGTIGGGDGLGNGGPNAPDAASISATGDAATPMGDAAGSMCRQGVAAAQLGSGHHNPGQDCMGSCHNHGFTLSGTLYDSSAGTNIIAGGTITVLDAAGKTLDLVSQLNGNFYTSSALMFPVTVVASDCPSVQTMTAPIAAGSGCNSNGCHTAAGQGRVHLP